MTSLIKNQVLKHLTKFFKDLLPEQLQLSAFKGSCELSNLQLEEKVLMELLSFPAWLTINKAICDQLTIKIPWTKIKSVPIQMNLNEVTVEVEVCEEFRDITSTVDDASLVNLINTSAVPSKYGFVDRVIDGITVTVNNVLITFKSRLMSANFNLSRVLLESRCPNWKQGELSLTRIKDVERGLILLFKVVEWQNMRLEAKYLEDKAPLRLITNHAQCRLTIKKKLDDCSVVAARIFVIFEDILWVLTFAQFISAASFVEYIFTLIKKSPVSKKTGLIDDQSNDSSQIQSSNTSFQQVPLISPLNTPHHSSQLGGPAKTALLTGNMSSASLTEQKFICYDLIETSLHLYIDKIDAHLYDDIEISPNSKVRDSGGALQTTLDQIQVDCYPYSRALSDRKHWYKWFDPSPSTRKQWFYGHFSEFYQSQTKRGSRNLHKNSDDQPDIFDTDHLSKDDLANQTPTHSHENLLSLTVLVKIKDYCMNCVATKDSPRDGLSKFIQTDKNYQMPSDMPSLYLELNYFYLFDVTNRMMIYENVPDPLAFMHLSPTMLLFDSPTLLFLHSFQVNLSKALVHLNDLFPDDTSAPKIHCRIEILMPQISLPAKTTSNQLPTQTSTLLVKSGKVTLSNTIYDRTITSKLESSIEKLKESPSQPINLSSTFQGSQSTRDNSCTGDWTKVWNPSLIENMNEFNVQNQLWVMQFEPVWMDFMNYDIDELSSGQRLEPIVEPVNAYVFVHLNLSPSLAKQLPIPKPNEASCKLESSFELTKIVPREENKRDVISVLVTVIDGPILANMDKVQFGFLQRLGMHVEKLLLQIKADASNIIQLESTVNATLEVNLTAYVKDIKARLILDKKTEKSHGPAPDEQSRPTSSQGFISAFAYSGENKLYNNEQFSSNILQKPASVMLPVKNQLKIADEKTINLVYSGCEQLVRVVSDPDPNLLDECEVASDASCLFLGPNSSNDIPFPNQKSSLTDGSNSSEASRRRSPIEDKLSINLDEMEQSSSLFAKVGMKPQSAALSLNESSVNQTLNRSQQQEIEIESVSYLEFSMSQLMVRRITETKRRQKF